MKKKKRFSFTAKALNSSEQILFHLRSNIFCSMKFAVESTKMKSSATSSCLQSSHQNSKRIRAISAFCDFILIQYLDHEKEMYISKMMLFSESLNMLKHTWIKRTQSAPKES